MSQHTLRTENLFSLCWPIFLQHMTHSVVVLVDFWFFSRIADEVAGTIATLLPIIWLGAFVIPVFAGTGVSVASQFMGAKQYEKVVPTYMMNLLFTGSMGAVFAAAMWWFSGDIGGWMGFEASLNNIASPYLGGMSAYFAFMGVLVAYNAVLSSRGMTQWLMYSAFLVAGLNLIFASLFFFVFDWGLRGVVAASVISVASATALSVWLVHVKLGVHFYLRGAWRDMRSVLRPMLRLGASNAFEPFSYSVQQIILSKLIIALGVVSMAAHGYAGRAQMFQITFSVTIALGAQILMAHWMGARRFDDVDRLFWRAIRWTTCVAVIYAFVFWLFADRVLAVFTHDPAVAMLGKTLLLVAVFLEPARAVNIVGAFTLKTVGDARFPLIIGVVFIWGILPVILGIDRTWGLTLTGLWICLATDEIVRAFINLWRWRTGKWRSMGFTNPPPETPPAEALEAGL